MYVCLQKPANKLKVHANGDIGIRYKCPKMGRIISEKPETVCNSRRKDVKNN